MHRRGWIAALALVAVGGVACSGPAAAPLEPAVQAVAPTPAVPVAEFGSSPPEAEVAEPGPILPKGTFVARSKTPKLTIWRGPSTSTRRRFAFPTRNPVGQRLVFLVVSAERDAKGGAWLKILLPIRPNGASGWVRTSAVTVQRVRRRIVVDLSERTLRYFRNGRLERRFSVGIGRPGTPTAVGTFYIWAQVPQASPTGPYGIFALGLSGFSPVLKDWPGGGRMAIHGTSNPADRGQLVSYGCIRVYNPEMASLVRMPLGTPVVIRN